MHLTFAGFQQDIKLREDLITYIIINNLQDKTTLLDDIDYHKLYSFLEGFQVFIHPSCYSKYMDCEGGAPVVLLDAQATAMPVISTSHCDIPSYVIHGKTGLLSEEKDIEKLSENICIFYKMGQIAYDNYCSAARLHVEHKYNITDNSIGLHKFYSSVLD